jgi:hypothetical protein
MGRTLLIGHPGVSWRTWLKEHRGARDLVLLDPGDPAQSPPGRLCLFRGERAVWYRFYGSLSPQRYPHVLLSSLAEMLPQAGDDALIQLFPYRPSPMLRHLVMLAAQLAKPSEILVASGTPIDQGGFPVGPVEVELEAAFPPMVQAAQRKAQWLKLLEQCAEHQIRLTQVTFEGTRLGSGTRVDERELSSLGLGGALHAEVCGSTLLLVATDEPEEATVSRVLDALHASRVHILHPDDLVDLLCSFSRQDGEDFGIGIVRCVDFATGQARVVSTAVPPAPIRILRLGAIRVDGLGNETGELKPWQV